MLDKRLLYWSNKGALNKGYVILDYNIIHHHYPAKIETCITPLVKVTDVMSAASSRDFLWMFVSFPSPKVVSPSIFHHLKRTFFLPELQWQSFFSTSSSRDHLLIWQLTFQNFLSLETVYLKFLSFLTELWFGDSIVHWRVFYHHGVINDKKIQQRCTFTWFFSCSYLF